MNLPSREYSLKLLKQKNPENIVKHSLKVEKIALFLASEFEKKGIILNKKFISIGALLHDVDKWGQIEKGFEYKKNEQTLAKNGFFELSEMISKSHLNSILKTKLNNWEEKIIFYADKRVNPNDKIVQLKERFEYVEKKYGKTPKMLKEIKNSEKLVLELEKELLKVVKNLELNELK